MKKSKWATVLSLVSAFSFVLAACGGGAASLISASPKPATEVTGKTIPEKGLSIAKVVSEKNEGLLVVSDAQFSGGLTVMTSDGMEPIWYALAADKPTPDTVRNTRGLVFTVNIMKARSFLAQNDIDNVQVAVGNIFSLVASNFLQGSQKEFSFVEVEVKNPPASAPGIPFSFLSTDVYHASAEDLVAERDKGVNADWLTFVKGDPNDPESGKQLALTDILISTPTQPQASPSTAPSASAAPASGS